MLTAIKNIDGVYSAIFDTNTKTLIVNLSGDAHRDNVLADIQNTLKSKGLKYSPNFSISPDTTVKTFIGQIYR